MSSNPNLCSSIKSLYIDLFTLTETKREEENDTGISIRVEKISQLNILCKLF